MPEACLHSLGLIHGLVVLVEIRQMQHERGIRQTQLGTLGELRFRKHGAAIKYLAVVGGRKEGVSFLKEVRAFRSQQVKEKTFYLGNLTSTL